MTTLRVIKDRNYAVINNEPLNDMRLSWGARGLLAYLLSKPNDWTINVKALINAGPAGEHKVRGLLKELMKCGYLNRIRIKHKGGTFTWESQIYETPALNPNPSPDIQTTSRFSTSGSSTSGSSTSGKPPDIVSTEGQSTEVVSTEKTKDKDSAARVELLSFLSAWERRFPNKPKVTRPKKGGKASKTFLSLEKKLDGWLSSKGDSFVLSYLIALDRAAASPSLQREGWFNVKWFLGSGKQGNDPGWLRCYNQEFAWKDEKRQGRKRSQPAPPKDEAPAQEAWTVEEFEQWQKGEQAK